ncbi:hypothetical protein M406DRAFT_251747 [Cryphonectria parasitica EP155]|uniref:Uncharacterized protein n=1 Tax=Cryphonectria parasitica (strain ATCC 38755 / EP155) TaxID=660469 RepID=A0A9P4Y6A5_CRYP1|nr:uncharacterized protein M406DRAFT_251747 [Cryphonectria parasitica EP155]KAF3767276.1 hypothetical protein M406DRAFT_251747 [Cryphonectria parasitica EP155]
MERVLERAPLLGNRQQDEESQVTGADHPIFLRAAHSPWRPLNQNVLGYVRAALLAYMIAAGGMLLDYKIKHRDDEHTNWRIPFQFSTVTWFLLILYHLMVTAWTITHMHWPDTDANDTRWESRLIRFMSPPEQTSDDRRRFYFSLFYTVTHVFALMNVMIYWTIMVPSGHSHWPSGGSGEEGLYMVMNADDGNSKFPPFKDVFSEGWFKPFSLFNLYVFPALVTVIESLFMNSMRRQEPVPSHLFGTMGSAALYLAYGAIGKLLTGHSPFFWMDEAVVGSKEKVAGYCTGFVCMAAAMFSMLYGLIGMRENASRAH